MKAATINKEKEKSEIESDLFDLSRAEKALEEQISTAKRSEETTDELVAARERLKVKAKELNKNKFNMTKGDSK